jgi:hypothetical protein
VNDELEEMWKEAVVKKIKVLSWRSSVGTEKKHENLSQDSRPPIYEPETSLYKATQLGRLIPMVPICMPATSFSALIKYYNLTILELR